MTGREFRVKPSSPSAAGLRVSGRPSAKRAPATRFYPEPSARLTWPDVSLQILELGTVPYLEALELQHCLVNERARGLRPDTLVLLEHPHVITRGRGYNGRTLGATKHPIFDIERGGDITYHGPGQMVGYPIIHLKERGLLIGQYLRLLENVLIEAVSAFDIQAERLKGFTGVWAGGRKLASIGVAVKSWVTYHGFALNVTTDLSQFRGIHPCGLEPEQMTSMERILRFPPDMARLRKEIGSSLSLRLRSKRSAREAAL